MLGLQPSEGSDCHFPTPSEAGGKLKKGTRRRKQSPSLGKEGGGVTEETGLSWEVGTLAVPGPLSAPFPLLESIMKGQEVTTPSGGHHRSQAARLLL